MFQAAFGLSHMADQIISLGTRLVSPQLSDVHRSAGQIVQFAEMNTERILNIEAYYWKNENVFHTYL